MIMNVWTFLKNNLKKGKQVAYINLKVPLDSLHNNGGRHTSVNKHMQMMFFPPHDVPEHPAVCS